MIVNIKEKHEYWNHEDISHEFIVGDLRNPEVVSLVIDDTIDEVYQLAADMGGAGYIFTGDNDANVMQLSRGGVEPVVPRAGCGPLAGGATPHDTIVHRGRADEHHQRRHYN